jgi:aspartyl/asparaginyl-tRNA synthetase
MRTLIKHVLARKEGTDSLEVAGWVRTRRDSKAFSFIELNDGSCLGNLQIVADLECLFINKTISQSIRSGLSGWTNKFRSMGNT